MSNNFGMKYDPDTGVRLGLANFPSVQVDTIGYQTLSEKVTAILGGTMDFHADESLQEYDQEEGNWSDSEPEYDPTNTYLDKTDIHDIQVETIEKLRSQTSVNKVEVTPGDTPVTTDTTVSSSDTVDNKE